MSKKSYIETDKLFKDELLQHEVRFEEAAWENMRALLDKSETPIPILIVPPKSNNNFKKLTFIIMTSLSLLTIASLCLIGSQSGSNTLNTSALKSISDDHLNTYDGLIQNEDNTESKTTNIALQNSKQIADDHFQSSTKFQNTMMDTGIVSKTVSIVKPIKTSLDTFKTILKDGKMYRVFYRKTWVPEEYEYINKPNGNIIEDAFLGIHFTAQRPRNLASMSAGFNLQFMSGNRIESKTIGLYMGLDWGMQFYGSGKKSNLVLNNLTQDSGYTKLSSHSMDLLGRVHLEYAKFPLIPYINFMAGPRLYSTGQTVASYMTLKQAESSTTNNAHTSVSMLYGFGLGARLRLSSVVSLDARYEWINGSPVRLVDMNQSSFNGLSYNLKINKIAPHLEQFKIGLIFNLSERDVEKKLIKEGYFKTYTIDSVQVKQSDSNTIVLPCPCTPCDKQTIVYPYNQNNSQPQNGGGSRNSSTPMNSGSSKSAFPGIKPSVKPNTNNR
jgi:hypothetical protein